MKIPDDNKNTPLDYSKNLNDLDSLLAEQSVPPQNFDPPDPPHLKPEVNSNKKPGLNFLDSPNYDEVEKQPIDFEEQETKRRAARGNAKITAEMIDHGLGTVGQMIAKSEESQSYKASTNELATLTEAWAGVVADYDFNIPPWVQLLFLYPSIYTPKMIKAFNDKRFNEMQNQINKLKTEVEILGNEKEKLSTEKVDE